MQKVRTIEKKVWSDELMDMHRVVDEELRAIRQMAAGLVPASEAAWSAPQHQCNGLQQTGNADSGDVDDQSDGFDLNSLKLKLSCDEDGEDPSVPEQYLSQSLVLDGGQTLSWYVMLLMFCVIPSPLLLTE